MQGWMEWVGTGVQGDGTTWLRMLRAGFLGDASNLYFFKEIYAFVGGELDEFRENVLARTMSIVGALALALMTLWVLVQGVRIVTGQMRETMAAFSVNMLRAVLIVSAATTFAVGGTKLSAFLTDDVNRGVTYLMTGRNENSFNLIDKNLGYMQIAMSSIDQLHVGESQGVQDGKDRALWFTGVGMAGPAITGGAMLLLNKVAMALIVGLGPLFILCLLFDQTKTLFQRWLMYGLGTLFSLGVLSAMVTLSMDAVMAVAAATWTGKILGNAEGITSQAMQQGGLGLLMTTLIVTAPPMAASFFQGVLGQFASYNAFGGTQSTPQRPGEPGYQGGGGQASGRAEPRTHDIGHATSLQVRAPGSAQLQVNQDAVRQGAGTRLGRHE